MFAIFLIFALVTAHAAELPSYIRICGRKDPNYDQCMVNNFNNIKDKLCTWIPELNMPPNEPIIVDKIVIYDTNNLKLYLRDIKISGFCDYVINSFHADPDRLHFDFDVTFQHLFMNASYDFNIHVLVPLANKGLVYITKNDVPLKLNMDLKVAVKNGEKKIYISKINPNINITLFKYQFDDNEKELVQLHQVLSNVVDSNTEDIINSVKPVIEKKIAQFFISNFNGLTHSNYEKFFPEKV